MRPTNVARGEYVFGASILLALIGSAIAWPVARAALGAGVAAGSIVVVVVLSLALLLWATRGRSRVALWLLVVWTAFSGWSVARQLAVAAPVNTVAIVTLVQIVLMVIGVALLFTRPARTWFAGYGA